MKKEFIKKTLLKHISNQNSFVDKNGKNHFQDLIDELYYASSKLINVDGQEMALKLRKQGLSIRQIAKKMGYKGPSLIQRWLARENFTRRYERNS